MNQFGTLMTLKGIKTEGYLVEQMTKNILS